MSRRYVLAPEAGHDLVQIWRYIKKNASLEMADRVESVIRDRIRDARADRDRKKRIRMIGPNTRI